MKWRPALPSGSPTTTARSGWTTRFIAWWNLMPMISPGVEDYGAAQGLTEPCRPSLGTPRIAPAQTVRRFTLSVRTAGPRRGGPPDGHVRTQFTGPVPFGRFRLVPVMRVLPGAGRSVSPFAVTSASAAATQSGLLWATDRSERASTSASDPSRGISLRPGLFGNGWMRQGVILTVGLGVGCEAPVSSALGVE